MPAKVAYHVTQRSNARQFLMASDAERWVYLGLFRAAVQRESLSVLGFCLMSSHVHLAGRARLDLGPRIWTISLDNLVGALVQMICLDGDKMTGAVRAGNDRDDWG